MDGDRLDIGEAISYGWNSMKENVGFFVLVFLIVWVVEGVFYGIGGAFIKYPVVTIILYVIGLLLGIFIQMSIVNITLRLNRGGEPDFKDMYSAYRYFGKFLLAAILYGLLVLAGLILFVIPGIYWAIKYHFFGYFVIEQNMDPLAAPQTLGRDHQGLQVDAADTLHSLRGDHLRRRDPLRDRAAIFHADSGHGYCLRLQATAGDLAAGDDACSGRTAGTPGASLTGSA